MQYAVTDYSSVAMDVAYLGKPVVYYQFDYERFRTFHLEEGYFHYEEDAFGPIAAEEAQVLAAILPGRRNGQNTSLLLMQHRM